ncbi:hypothetical protein QBC37DRAFT_429629 [Rhypophila decipiens]|uniref:Uncharacterized protein n=1 Tax=Rhypophila decipiens TaxID=261697 RepID=A0AAN6Y296_9PEZI|nr:hypothetical protein QBC37DRAFT_429629 [Rhypophila decipiens]
MAPTTRSQSAKSPTTERPNQTTSDPMHPANLTLPLTPAQIFALHPSLASKLASETELILPQEEITELHTIAKTAPPSVLKNALTLRCVGLGEHESQSPLSRMGLHPQGVLLLAIDPATKNSLLHSAISAKRIENASALMGLFGPQMGHNGDDPGNGRNIAIRKLFWHLNADGETMLHAAVRTGHLKTVVGTYRILCLRSVNDLVRSGGSDDDEEGEEVAGEEEKDDDRDDWERFEHKGPVNEDDLGEGGYITDIDEEEWEDWLGAEWVEKLLFVVARNAEGKTAEELAKDLGCDRIVVWLERLTDTLDPKRRRESEVEMARMKRYVTWRKFEDEDGPERHRRRQEQYQRLFAGHRIGG